MVTTPTKLPRSHESIAFGREPRTVKVSVPRTDAETGKVTFRRLHRRLQLCSQGGRAGGFAMVNNGPEFASQLARALAAW